MLYIIFFIKNIIFHKKQTANYDILSLKIKDIMTNSQYKNILNNITKHTATTF